MANYNIDSFDRMSLVSGRINQPYKQWLQRHQRPTKGHDYARDLAIITHYLQNKGMAGLQLPYEAEARELAREYYLAAHTDLADDTLVTDEQIFTLFSPIFEAPIHQMYEANNEFTFIDLFAGIGGFRIALEELGGRCVFASEINRAARKTYGWNHGVIPFGDITLDETKSRIPEHIDVLCGGFPCQPFSMAGNRLGFDDPVKGTLFHDIVDIIDRTHPEAVFLENVQGLLTIKNFDGSLTIETIKDVLVFHGYRVAEPEIVNAKNFGLAQNRDRVFIAAFRDRDAREFKYPTGEGFPEVTFGDIREQGVVPSRYYMSNQYWQTLVRHREAQRAQGRGYGYRIVEDNEVGHTLMLGGMGLERNLVRDFGNQHVNEAEDPRGELNHAHIRVLTERECAKMQGFPDEFDYSIASRHAAYDQFGNSVAVPAIREMGRNILDYVGIEHI